MSRTNGAILVARKDGAYYFVNSVFKHEDDFFGCTGMCVEPVTEEMMEDLLSIDNLVERFGDYWEEKYEGDAVCEACDGLIDEDGCEKCGYPSIESFCGEIGQYDGSDAVIDNQYQCVEALNAVCEDKIEYADVIGCGRLFSSITPDYFDEIYNLKALVAALAFGAGAVDYEYAIKVIFGE